MQSLAVIVTVLVLAFTVLRITQSLERSKAQEYALMREWMMAQSTAISTAVTQVTETVAKGIQTAQTPLPPPAPPPPSLTRDQLTAAVQDIAVKYDYSDPTDGVAWLGGPERDSVAMIDPNDPEPYGIPGLRATPLDLSQFPPPQVSA